VLLSIVIITYNEELNIGRTLKSVQPLVQDGKGEIIVVDSGSTDRTVEIAKSYGAKVFVEEWKGFAAQKNSAIEKATGDWILSLDADEEVDADLQKSLEAAIASMDLIVNLQRKAYPEPIMLEDTKADAEKYLGAKPEAEFAGLWIPRKNKFLGRWIKHGGFWPDPKLRFFRRGSGRLPNHLVHETIEVTGATGRIPNGAIIHHSYPTLSDYIEHMNRYSSLGAEMVVARGKRHFLFIDILFRPFLTFIYNYFFQLGFLDGREGLLLHLGHAAYVSWKYAKVWELQRKVS